MKKLLFAALLFVSVAILSSTVNAQSDRSRPSLKNLSVSNVEASESKITAPKSKAETRAFKNFSKNYKHASNVSWFYSGEVMVANFSENNIKKRAMYLDNGRWLRTLVSYDESELSDYVKSMVKENYPKFRITSVTEVHELDMVAYFINIENDKQIKQVISYEDRVWTHKQFRKS